MPILTPEQKATLKARLQQADVSGLSDRDAADALSAPTTIPNPAPPGTVPKPFQTKDLLGKLDNPTLARLRKLPSLARLLDDIAAMDIAHVENWLAVLQSSEGPSDPAPISAAQATALAAAIHATQPDPNYQAQVPGPSWVRSNFSGVAFTLPDGRSYEGMITAEIVAEARS
jgi:hypothetical protein